MTAAEQNSHKNPGPKRAVGPCGSNSKKCVIPWNSFSPSAIKFNSLQSCGASKTRARFT